MKTLGVFVGGIGDTLLAGPAFAELHAQGTLDLAGNPERLALIRAAGACDTVYDLDQIKFHSVFDEPSSTLREFLPRYDRAVVWMRDDGALRETLQICGVNDARVFPGLPPDDWMEHASDYYLSCIGESARPEPRPPFRINWEGEAPAEPRYDVVVHPGSGSMKKNWPIEDFVEAADTLAEAGRKVHWLRGPAENSIEYPTDARVVEPGGLIDLSRQLAAARLYIGNDSGITHLAAATGCHTVAVFGPTNPAVWAPRGDLITAIAGTPWPTVEAVLRTVGVP